MLFAVKTVGITCAGISFEQSISEANKIKHKEMFKIKVTTNVCVSQFKTKTCYKVIFVLHYASEKFGSFQGHGTLLTILPSKTRTSLK